MLVPAILPGSGILSENETQDKNILMHLEVQGVSIIFYYYQL